MKSRLELVFGLMALVFLTLLSIVEINSGTEPTIWLSFIGRFHPVLLHLPIGLFAAILILEVTVLFHPAESSRQTIRILLIVTFVSSVIAATCGILLSWEGGYAGETLNLHKWSGIVIAALFFVLMITDKYGYSRHAFRRFYFAGLIAGGLVLTMTGHWGGTLTHGTGFLTRYLPFSIDGEKVAGSVNAPVFDTHIQPVLRDYCVSCHGPDKEKGGLRLDTFENMQSGSDNGAVIVAGNSDVSLLIERLQLPMNDEEHMPPEGKVQPGETLITLLAWWIEQGASPDALPSDLNITSEVEHHFVLHEQLALLPRQQVEQKLGALPQTDNLLIYFLAINDNRLAVRGNRAGDADIEALLTVKENIVHLNLAGSRISNDALGYIKEMTNLTNLQLQNTAINDMGIAFLTSLNQLESLNLNNTTVTDASMVALGQLKKLKRLYVVDTNITADGTDEVVQALSREVEAQRLRDRIARLQLEIDGLNVRIESGLHEELLNRIENSTD